MANSLASLSVMHLFVGSAPGGVLKYITNIAEASRNEGATVVLAGQRGAWHAMVEQADLPWIDIPITGGPLHLWRSAALISPECTRRGIQVIHAHHRRATLVGRLAQRRLGAGHPQLLYTLHLTDMPMGIPWRWFSDFGDHCHAPSMQAKRWLIDIADVSESKVTLIPHGVESGRWPTPTPTERAAARGQFQIRSDAPIAAYVGRLEDPKNESWILDVASRHPATHWLIAGDGPNRGRFERRVRDLGLGQYIHMLGDCDPLPVYHAADALLLPSAREGFSYVCAEAMSCGVPVLRTRTAGTEEMIIENVTGRSCEINHDAFISAAGEFLADRQQLARMGEAAARHIRAHLTFERQVEQTIALYHKLAGVEMPS